MITIITTRDGITCRLFCANSSTNISVDRHHPRLSPNVPRTHARNHRVHGAAAVVTCVQGMLEEGVVLVLGETDEINQISDNNTTAAVDLLLQQLQQPPCSESWLSRNGSSIQRFSIWECRLSKTESLDWTIIQHFNKKSDHSGNLSSHTAFRTEPKIEK